MRDSTIPRGLCQCGCGATTGPAKKTDRRKGHVKGEPVSYVAGHQTRYNELPIRVEDRGFDSPCHVWQASVNSKGYPVRRDASRNLTYLVHRDEYVKHYGALPAAFVVHHRCRTPRCVNPLHLEAVTHAVHAQRHKELRRLERLDPAVALAAGSEREVC